MVPGKWTSAQRGRVVPSSDARAVAAEDAVLARRCRRGDPQAIRGLIERYQGEVFGLCVRLLGHRQDAEDVTQEVFLRVFRSLGRWDASRPLRPWILAITANRCRTWGSRRTRGPKSVDFLPETAVAAPADDAAELLAEIDAAVEVLRPGFREAFVLYHENGQSYEQIARALGRPVGTVKTWLHRARMEVLKRLQRRGMVSVVIHELR